MNANDDNRTLPMGDTRVEGDPAATIGHASQPQSGLHVRCPHCRNPIELVPDAELESIQCKSCGSQFSLTSDDGDGTRDSRSTAEIGHFKLIERLGMGAFGAVWKALDTELDRTVAIKIPRSGQLDKRRQDFFVREARSAAQLRHPNIVPVYEVGREGETLYIVSEFVRGVTLADRLTAGPFSSREAAQVCTKIADALHHAHEHGVIHRDLKPGNVMLDGDGEPHLMDFGLARREAGEITMTLDGQVLGTPAYMSPEQAQGESHVADRRSDIYSLGVILFEMLTGELPFRGNIRMLIHQVIHDEPPSPRKLAASVPKDLETLTMKCMEKAPGRRPATARHLADELERFLRGEPILARPLSRPARLARWAKRRPAIAAGATLLIILAVVGPATAVVIENQRRRLTELVDEKNSLISRYAVDTQRAVAELTAAKGRLDLWEGRASPWELWPSGPSQGPKHELLVKLYEQQYSQMAAQLKNADSNSATAARGHVALAILADEMRRPGEAGEHWRAAAERLDELHEANPREPSYALALADCHRQLARLSAADESTSHDHLARAAALLEGQFKAEGDPAPAVDLLETLLDDAVLVGFEKAGDSLAEASRLERTLVQLPAMQDPEELYGVACLLARKRPLLDTEQRPRVPDSGAKPANGGER